MNKFNLIYYLPGVILNEGITVESLKRDENVSGSGNKINNM